LATLHGQITALQARLAALYGRRSRQVEDLEGLLGALLGTREVCEEMLGSVERGERLA
jgi:hypothetical protein